MVGIVESVEEVFVEGMDILQAWESIKNGLELLAKSLRSKFDLASIETWQQYINQNSSDTKVNFSPLILLILKPARICVGSFR